MSMPDSDDVTARLRSRAAYLGVTGITPTADLMPTKVLPAGLHDPDCQDVLRYLLYRVRHLYVTCRRAPGEDTTRRADRYGADPLRWWDGGLDWKQQYHAPIWARIAHAVLDRGLDLEAYVPWAFARVAKTGSPVPNKLLSPAVLEGFLRDEQPHSVHQCGIRLKCMGTYLEMGIFTHRSRFDRTMAEATLGALRDSTVTLRPFFRYSFLAVLAPKAPACRPIMAMYRAEALREYASSVRACEAVYGQAEMPAALTEFRPVIEKARQALAELVEGDQTGWMPISVGPSSDARHGEPDEPR
jgi:hypothetical protein